MNSTEEVYSFLYLDHTLQITCEADTIVTISDQFNHQEDAS